LKSLKKPLAPQFPLAEPAYKNGFHITLGKVPSAV